MLPASQIKHEPPELAASRTLTDLTSKIGGEDAAVGDVPPFTVLRCALEELAMTGKKPTREELFAFLEERLPWLKTDKGANYEVRILQNLSLTSQKTHAP